MDIGAFAAGNAALLDCRTTQENEGVLAQKAAVPAQKYPLFPFAGELEKPASVRDKPFQYERFDGIV